MFLAPLRCPHIISSSHICQLLPKSPHSTSPHATHPQNKRDYEATNPATGGGARVSIFSGAEAGGQANQKLEGQATPPQQPKIDKHWRRLWQNLLHLLQQLDHLVLSPYVREVFLTSQILHAAHSAARFVFWWSCWKCDLCRSNDKLQEGMRCSPSPRQHQK